MHTCDSKFCCELQYPNNESVWNFAEQTTTTTTTSSHIQKCSFPSLIEMFIETWTHMYADMVASSDAVIPFAMGKFGMRYLKKKKKLCWNHQAF